MSTTLRIGSSRIAVVMSQKSAEESLAANATDLRCVVDGQVFRWFRCSGGQCLIA